MSERTDLDLERIRGFYPRLIQMELLWLIGFARTSCGRASLFGTMVRQARDSELAIRWDNPLSLLIRVAQWSAMTPLFVRRVSEAPSPGFFDRHALP